MAENRPRGANDGVFSSPGSFHNTTRGQGRARDSNPRSELARACRRSRVARERRPTRGAGVGAGSSFGSHTTGGGGGPAVHLDLRDLSCASCFSFSAASISSTALVEMSVSTRVRVTARRARRRIRTRAARRRRRRAGPCPPCPCTRRPSCPERSCARVARGAASRALSSFSRRSRHGRASRAGARARARARAPEQRAPEIVPERHRGEAVEVVGEREREERREPEQQHRLEALLADHAVERAEAVVARGDLQDPVAADRAADEERDRRGDRGREQHDRRAGRDGEQVARRRRERHRGQREHLRGDVDAEEVHVPAKFARRRRSDDARERRGRRGAARARARARARGGRRAASPERARALDDPDHVLEELFHVDGRERVAELAEADARGAEYASPPTAARPSAPASSGSTRFSTSSTTHSSSFPQFGTSRAASLSWPRRRAGAPRGARARAVARRLAGAWRASPRASPPFGAAGPERTPSPGKRGSATSATATAPAEPAAVMPHHYLGALTGLK